MAGNPEVRAILDDAYRAARTAGIEPREARRLADRAAQRVVLGGETKSLVIDDEIRKALS